MKKKIVVGLDFDGVVAYNPVRIFRLPVALVKRHVFGITRTHFYIPKTDLQKLVWTLAFESSLFPARGASLLRQLVTEGKIEAHLVTGRFSFMHDRLIDWLVRWRMKDLFASLSFNERDEEPHLFKERVIRQKRFNYFVEDNLDIVRYLEGKTSTKIYWIYNIFDRWQPYDYKYPYLEKALRSIR